MASKWGGRGAVIAALLVGATMATLVGTQASHGQTRAYAGANDPYAHAVLWSLGLESSLVCAPQSVAGTGAACFDIPRDATSVAVEIDDVSLLPVGGEVTFRDHRGYWLGVRQSFCDHTTVSIPQNAVRVVVAASAYPTECDVRVPASAGTVTASFG